jgi:hypothetical protein
LWSLTGKADGRPGACRHPLQQLGESRAVLGASLVDPVVVEVLEQFAPREFECILQPALREEPLELGHDRSDLIGAGERDGVARGEQVAIGVRAERAAQGRSGAAQARACALVEDVGPEARRELAARARSRSPSGAANTSTRSTDRCNGLGMIAEPDRNSDRWTLHPRRQRAYIKKGRP